MYAHCMYKYMYTVCTYHIMKVHVREDYCMLINIVYIKVYVLNNLWPKNQIVVGRQLATLVFVLYERCLLDPPIWGRGLYICEYRKGFLLNVGRCWKDQSWAYWQRKVYCDRKSNYKNRMFFWKLEGIAILCL